MDEHIRRAFLREIERQSAFALMAIEDLISAITAGNAVDRVWYCVQGLLIAAGNVSKLLWPDQRYSARGVEMRKDLQVADDSILGPRTFRNRFWDFDERLERWAASTGGRVFVDSNVGPPGLIFGLDETKFMRNFDTKNLTITFQGDSYPLQPITSALIDLQRRAALLANEISRPTELPVPPDAQQATP